MAFISDEKIRASFKHLFNVLHTAQGRDSIVNEQFDTGHPIFSGDIFTDLPGISTDGTLDTKLKRVRTWVSSSTIQNGTTPSTSAHKLEALFSGSIQTTSTVDGSEQYVEKLIIPLISDKSSAVKRQSFHAFDWSAQRDGTGADQNFLEFDSTDITTTTYPIQTTPGAIINNSGSRLRRWLHPQRFGGDYSFTVYESDANYSGPDYNAEVTPGGHLSLDGTQGFGAWGFDPYAGHLLLAELASGNGIELVKQSSTSAMKTPLWLVAYRYIGTVGQITSATSASHALTASYIEGGVGSGGTGAGFPFSGSAVITGSLTIEDGAPFGEGNLSANSITASNISASAVISASTFYGEFIEISSSIEFASGSTIFGDDSGDSHEFTGSVSILGDLDVNGGDIFNVSAGTNDMYVKSSQTGSFASGSDVAGILSDTGSYITNSQTGSFIVNSQTGSFIVNSQTGSFASGSDVAGILADTGSYLVEDSSVSITSLTASGDISASGGTITGQTLVGTLSTGTQTNITSVGALSSLAVDNITIDGSAISSSNNLTFDVSDDIILNASGNQVSFRTNNFQRFLFNLDSSPEIDVTGPFTIDGNQMIKLDSGTNNIELVGNVTSSGTISTSGNIIGNKFIGDGSELTGITTGGGGGFPFSGSAVITGSMVVDDVNDDDNNGVIFQAGPLMITSSTGFVKDAEEQTTNAYRDLYIKHNSPVSSNAIVPQESIHFVSAHSDRTMLKLTEQRPGGGNAEQGGLQVRIFPAGSTQIEPMKSTGNLTFDSKQGFITFKSGMSGSNASDGKFDIQEGQINIQNLNSTAHNWNTVSDIKAHAMSFGGENDNSIYWISSSGMLDTAGSTIVSASGVWVTNSGSNYITSKNADISEFNKGDTIRIKTKRISSNDFRRNAFTMSYHSNDVLGFTGGPNGQQGNLINTASRVSEFTSDFQVNETIRIVSKSFESNHTITQITNDATMSIDPAWEGSSGPVEHAFSFTEAKAMGGLFKLRTDDFRSYTLKEITTIGGGGHSLEMNETFEGVHWASSSILLDDNLLTVRSTPATVGNSNGTPRFVVDKSGRIQLPAEGVSPENSDLLTVRGRIVLNSWNTGSSPRVKLYEQDNPFNPGALYNRGGVLELFDSLGNSRVKLQAGTPRMSNTDYVYGLSYFDYSIYGPNGVGLGSSDYGVVIGGTTKSTPGNSLGKQMFEVYGDISASGDIKVKYGDGIELGGVYRTTWPAGGSGGGTDSFQLLTDTPSSYTGEEFKYLRVKSTGGIEFANIDTASIGSGGGGSGIFAKTGSVYSSGQKDLEITGSLTVSGSSTLTNIGRFINTGSVRIIGDGSLGYGGGHITSSGNALISGSIDIGMGSTGASLTLRRADKSAGWYLNSKNGLHSYWNPTNPSTTHLGIKTTTPSEALTVEGNISSSGAVYAGKYITLKPQPTKGSVFITGSLTVSGSSTLTNIGQFSQDGDTTIEAKNITLVPKTGQIFKFKAGDFVEIKKPISGIREVNITGSLKVSGSSTLTNIGRFVQFDVDPGAGGSIDPVVDITGSNFIFSGSKADFTGSVNSTGNVDIGGTLTSDGNFTVGSNKFTINSLTGNATSLGGIVAVTASIDNIKTSKLLPKGVTMQIGEAERRINKLYMASTIDVSGSGLDIDMTTGSGGARLQIIKRTIQSDNFHPGTPAIRVWEKSHPNEFNQNIPPRIAEFRHYNQSVEVWNGFTGSNIQPPIIDDIIAPTGSVWAPKPDELIVDMAALEGTKYEKIKGHTTKDFKHPPLSEIHTGWHNSEPTWSLQPAQVIWGNYIYSGSNVYSSSIYTTWATQQGVLVGLNTVEPAAVLDISGSEATSSQGAPNDIIRVRNDLGVPVLKVKKDRMVLRHVSSSAHEATMSVDTDNNLVINDNMKVNHNDVRFKSPDKTKEIRIEVSNDGDLKFKDNNNAEIVKLKEGGKMEVGSNTANSQSLTNWEGSISASGYIKVKNTFLGHNYGWPDNFILAHRDRVESEDMSMAAAMGFAFGQGPSGYTYINAGDGTFGGNKSIMFYQAGAMSSMIGTNENWQFGPQSGLVTFQPPERVTVKGNISASGDLYLGGKEIYEVDGGSKTKRLTVGSTNIFSGDLSASGDIYTEGNIYANEYHTTYNTSSVIYSSGSTKFGDTSDDVHTFTGSISSSGNVNFGNSNSSDGSRRFDFGVIDSSGFGTTITSGSQIRVGADSQASSSIKLMSSNKGWEIGTSKMHSSFTSAGSLKIDNNSGTNVMTMQLAGNVGIGTQSPTNTLHVGGTLKVDSNVDFDGDLDVDGTTNLDAVDIDGTVNLASSLTMENMNWLYLSGSDTGMRNYDDRILFKVDNNSASHVFHKNGFAINADTTLYTSGDLPAELTVNGAISASGDIYIRNQRGIHFGEEVGGHNDVHLVSTGTTGTLLISGSNANAIKLDSKNARIGIGVDTPSYNLHLEGDISASGHLYVGDQMYLTNNKYLNGRLTTGQDRPLIGVNSDNNILIGSGHFDKVKSAEPIEVAGDVSSSGNFYGKHFHYTHHAFYVNHTNEAAIPIAGSLNEVTTDYYYHRMIAPFKGRLVKVMVKGQGVGGNSTIGFATASNGTESTTLVASSGVGVSMVSADTTYTFNMNSSYCSFNEGEALSVHFTAGANTIFGTSVTCVWEYDTGGQ